MTQYLVHVGAQVNGRETIRDYDLNIVIIIHQPTCLNPLCFSLSSHKYTYFHGMRLKNQ